MTRMDRYRFLLPHVLYKQTLSLEMGVRTEKNSLCYKAVLICIVLGSYFSL